MTYAVLYLLILALAGLLFAAYRYHQHTVNAQEAWLRLRIHVEMGDTWYQRWKHLAIDQLWLQFTYDIAHPVLAGRGVTDHLFEKYAKQVARDHQ
jgi:hypothetical protein